MQVRKDKYKDNPILPEGLDLVEEDEQITHQIQLEDDLQVQEGLSKLTGSPITTKTHPWHRHLQVRPQLSRERGEIQGDQS